MDMSQYLQQQNDFILVQKAQSGDATAFGILYDSYIKKIYNFIYYKTLNKEVAEDVCSETFIKAWKNIGQLHDGSFSAWLYTIARNSVIDYYRQAKDHSNIEDCWDLSDGKDFLEKIDCDLKIEIIKQALSSLKIEERDLLIMRLWLDLPFKEIAEQLNKTEGAAKMSFSRALTSLKNKIPLAIFILGPELLNIWK